MSLGMRMAGGHTMALEQRMAGQKLFPAQRHRIAGQAGHGNLQPLTWLNKIQDFWAEESKAAAAPKQAATAPKHLQSEALPWFIRVLCAAAARVRQRTI